VEARHNQQNFYICTYMYTYTYSLYIYAYAMYTYIRLQKCTYSWVEARHNEQKICIFYLHIYIHICVHIYIHYVYMHILCIHTFVYKHIYTAGWRPIFWNSDNLSSRIFWRNYKFQDKVT